jgi:hypothetical protein
MHPAFRHAAPEATWTQVDQRASQLEARVNELERRLARGETR